MGFTKATKRQAKLRMAIEGPAGSGKTFSALAVAKHLGKKIAAVDTEHGSMAKYADLFDFDATELTRFGPDAYIEAIQEAERAGYDVLIIDSLSHEWSGPGGVLEMAGDNFYGWKTAGPAHDRLVNAMLSARIHVIATMRSKMEYAIEKDEKTGKTAPKKVGMAPITRDTTPYEFDVVGVLDNDHTMKIEKTRCPRLDGMTYHKPGEDVATVLIDWLKGAPPPPELEPALAAGRGLISTKPFAELGAALKAHIEACPANVREEVRRDLLVAYRACEASESKKAT